MVRRVLCATGVAMVVLAIGSLAAREAQAQFPNRIADPPFSNYTAPAGYPQGVVASLYPSPRPTPQLVGHTYITYPPLAPHEMLYTHHRNYRHTNADGGTTKTLVTWGHAYRIWPFHTTSNWAIPTPHHPLGVGSNPPLRFP